MTIQFGWTNRPSGASCSDLGFCAGGVCQQGCLIDGKIVPLGNTAAEGCLECDPSVSRTSWNDLPTGTPCGAIGDVKICHAGTCQRGCSVDGGFVPPADLNPQNGCESCQPLANTGAWSRLAEGTLCDGGGSTCDAYGDCVPPDAGFFGNPTILIRSVVGEAFGPVSLAFSDGAGELFYSVLDKNGGATFELQHLSPAGSVVGRIVQVATGSPETAPVVSVATDGVEISCCWEDFGLDPNISGRCAPATEQQPTILCNSVPTGGVATDDAMGGGFIGCGQDPQVAALTGAALLVFPQPGAFQVQDPYGGWGDGAGEGTAGITSMAITGLTGGFEALSNDGQQVTFYGFGVPFTNNQTGGGSLPGSSATGAMAMASNGSSVGIVLQQGSSISTQILDPDAGVSNGLLTLRNEQAIGPVAMTRCGGGLGFAYVVRGGDVLFREIEFNGMPIGSQATRLANLNADPQSIALASGDAGAFLAVGTTGAIGVYPVTCR